MPKIVSNTTPIISLLKIAKLEILKELYGQVFIPQEAFNEVEEGLKVTGTVGVLLKARQLGYLSRLKP